MRARKTNAPTPTADTQAPRLAALAKAINEKQTFYRATLTETHVSTDRKPAGCRYITHTGKGRKGNKLVVTDSAGKVVFDHNSAGTYRTNDEAASKVERLMGRIWEDEFRLPRPHMADCDASPTGYFFGQRPCTCSAPKRNSRKG